MINPTVLENIPLFMGLLSFTGGAISLYGSSVKKRYAAERDFNHLRRNYEALASNIAALSDLQDDRFDRIDLNLIEIKATLAAHQSLFRTTRQQGPSEP